jgi:gliding motility-associated lipoprotein GldD
MSRKIIAAFMCGLIFASLGSCKEDTIPKPAGMLRLEYPMPEYASFENNCPFIFDMNGEAVISDKGNCNLTITYPKMKATIYLTYKPIKNDIEDHLRDAQKLTYKHTIKADDILEQPFVNQKDRVFGMFYKVGGNAATNSQFYVTDSTKHFVTGSAYFYAKPNFDSIMPATNYIKNDMQVIMETLRWKK